MSGCFSGNSHNEDRFKEGTNAYLLRETQLKEKNDVEWFWTLIDGRTGDVLLIADLEELGFQGARELDLDKVVNLARQLALEIDQPLVNPTITRGGEIREGKNRVILAEEELITRMLSLSYYNKNLVLPIYEEEPQVTIEDLQIIKNTRLSTFATYFNPSVAGRSENIRLSSQAIDHYVIGPNEVFSFNKVVGQRTKERGYQEAKEIVNQEFVMGIGGGICQTSSTLYNAIEIAGLDIIERYTHSRDIGYVPRDRDATVSWGGPDFRFRNPYDYPLLISSETNLQTGKIEVHIYGAYELDRLITSTQ